MRKRASTDADEQRARARLVALDLQRATDRPTSITLRGALSPLGERKLEELGLRVARAGEAIAVSRADGKPVSAPAEAAARAWLGLRIPASGQDIADDYARKARELGRRATARRRRGW